MRIKFGLYSSNITKAPLSIIFGLDFQYFELIYPYPRQLSRSALGQFVVFVNINKILTLRLPLIVVSAKKKN